MAQWVRVNVELDLKINEGDSLASVVRDLTEGLAQGDPDQSRITHLAAREVEDARPETRDRCGCMDVIG